MTDPNEDTLPPSVRRTATCRTPDCAVAGIPYRAVPYGPNWACVCGRCGQLHTDLADI